MKSDRPVQTGSQTVGPFFHYALIHGGEHVLINEKTQGERIIVSGTIYDGDGEPVTDALVEIWQADSNGFFNHPADFNRAQADPAFRGFGRSETSQNGVFSFETVKPGAISETAAPYINVRVFARGMLIHAVTRLYFDDEPGNERDSVFASLDPVRRETLIAHRTVSDGAPAYRFDIRLQGEGETIFFNA